MPEDESVLSRGARAPDLTLSYGAGPSRVMEVRFGSGGELRPLVIIIHGGFWRADIDRAHTRPMADTLAAAGWTVALPEYSRVPQDPEVTLADLTLVLGESAGRVATHNGQVVVLGHSAGGHLALWAAAARVCPTLIGTLALSPVADLRLAYALGLGEGAVSRFLGCDPVSRPDLDPCRMVAPVTATTIVHGIDDAIVPLVVSESYIALQMAAQVAAPMAAHPAVRLIPVAGAGHYALIDPRAPAWPTVIAQLAAFPTPSSSHRAP